MTVLRRGKDTEAIFDRAITLTRVQHNSFTGEDAAAPVTADEAAVLFAAHPHAKMQLRGDGVYAFVFNHPQGYIRIEIEVAK